MPNALARLAVEGMPKSITVRWTGTVAENPVAVTAREPSYAPAAWPWGTRTSTHATRFSPAGTSMGKAFRVSWKYGSTVGIRASGHRPSAPSLSETVVTS